MRARLSVVRGMMLLAGVILTGASTALAQGVLANMDAAHPQRLPRLGTMVAPRPAPPPSSYKIGAIDVDARLNGQVAQVQMTQTFVNTGSTTLEASFVFPLPYDGAIDQLTLLVDGQEIAGRLLSREEARRAYEDIVRRNRDPALLEWLGAGMFQTNVFPIPAGAQRKVSLRYTQVCRVDHGLTEFSFPLSTAKYSSQPVEKLSVRVAIEAERKIKNIYSPSHELKADRKGKRAVVTYEIANRVPVTDFRLFYDVGDEPLGARVISYRDEDDKEEGHFLLLASPDVGEAAAKPAPKTVVLVIDRSGSMSGEKMEQARGAARFVVNNLREGDLFNVVAYDSAVEPFRPELEKFNSETREAALGFIDGLYAGGSTNIDGALTTALEQLKDPSRPSYVLFLTDGLPTVGEQNEMKIVAHARQTNEVRARVISFGVGYDVNSRLLDRLVRENFGQSLYVRPNEDIEEHVARLYDKIKAPVMTDVKVAIDIEGRKSKSAPVSRLYPREPGDIFAGEQLVIAGRYKDGGAGKVTITGTVDGKERKFEFPAEFVDKHNGQANAFVGRIWATRRIGEIIDEIDLKGHNQELVNELVELSKRYALLTPYTSFLADETVPLRDGVAASGRVVEELRLLTRVEGEAGVGQRAAKNDFREAQTATAGRVPTNFGAPLNKTGSGTLPLALQAPGAVAYQLADRDALVVAENVRQLGDKAFYCREQRWIDSTVTAEQEKSARRIEQFSPEFFELAARHTSASVYFTCDEPVLVNLSGQAYLIEPAK